MLKVKNNEHPLVQRAFQWAEHWHRDQKRHDGSQYIEHPVRVAQNVSKYTSDPHVIAAALCHDVLEDCKEVIFNILLEKTNLIVATLVSEVTDPEMPWAERIAWRLAEIPNMSEQAKLIKTADIDDNSFDPSSYKNKDRIGIYYRNRIDILYAINTEYSLKIAGRIEQWLDKNVPNT